MAMVVLLDGDTPVFVAGTGLAGTHSEAVPALLIRLAPTLETPARRPLPATGASDESAAIHVIEVKPLKSENCALPGLLVVMDIAPGALGPDC